MIKIPHLNLAGTLRKASKMTSRTLSKPFVALLIMLQMVGSLLLINPSMAQAATLTGGSVSLGDSRPSTATSYSFEFDNVTTSTIRCIEVEFSTSPSTISAVSGLDASSGDMTDGSSDFVPTPASWTVTPATGGVAITLAGGETPASATDRSLVLTNITNGNTANTPYYAHLNTYSNVDCSTGPVDSGVVSYIYTTGQAVSLTVDPSLSFTVAGVSSGGSVNGATTNVTTTATTIPFARVVTSGQNAIAEQLLTVSTNAANGYTVYARYTGILTSGGNTITDHTGTNASPTSFSAAGTESFGYTTSDTLSGGSTRFSGNLWAGFDTTNREVMFHDGPASSQTADLGYQVGIAGATEAGEYTTTVILTATALY